MTHLLAVPLMHRQAADVVNRYEWWSEDLTTRELISIGAGVRELVATIRAEDEPAQLKTMLREALHNGVTLTYRETAAGPPFPVVLIGDAAAIQPDRDLYPDGRYEVTVRMRRLDGGTLDGLL